MWALLIVLLNPRIQVRLEFLPRPIDLLPERDAIEFVQHDLVESLTDPVGLGMPRFRPGVLDILYRKIEFVLVAL